MATTTKYDEIADDVLRGVGGKSNVKSVTHCATRLRFALKDAGKADKAAIENTRGVITVVEAGGQFQVVIGNAVGNVYQSLVARSGLAAGESGGGGILGTAINLVTSIFTPFIWVLAGTGLMKALLTVGVKIWPTFAGTSTYAILFVAADAAFTFLPILIAITAAKRFNANQFVSVAIAGAMIYTATVAVIPGAGGASLTLQAFATGGGDLNFLGIPVIMISYLSSVIPTILAVWAQSHLERWLGRVFPEALRNFLTPMFTIAIIVPIVFLVIGPVSDWIGRGVSSGVNWLWDLSPIIGGAVMGAAWQIFVIFGVHWGFVPVFLQDISTQGYSLLMGALFAAVLAQAGATTAVFLKTRNRELKEIAGPAAISAFLAGISEPAIYGVTLRLKKPFIYGCIGGFIGGGIAAAGGSAPQGFVFPGAITIASTIDIGNFTLQVIGTVAAFLIAFVLTMVLGFKDLPATQHAAGEEAVAEEGTVASEAIQISVPVAGQVLALNAVPDKVFSSGAMGSGLAVIPTEGKVHAPVTGTLLAVMPHAYGIKGDNGIEVLVHIGLDTVQLNGKHFSPQVKTGDRVEMGQLLCTVDLDGIAADGYNPMTILIVTNSMQYSAVVPVAEGDVQPSDLALDVV